MEISRDKGETRRKDGETSRRTHRQRSYLPRMTGKCGPDQQTTSSPAGPSPSPSTPCGLSPLQLPSMEGLPSSLPMLLLLHLLERLSSFLRWQLANTQASQPVFSSATCSPCWPAWVSPSP